MTIYTLPEPFCTISIFHLVDLESRSRSIVSQCIESTAVATNIMQGFFQMLCAVHCRARPCWYVTPVTLVTQTSKSKQQSASSGAGKPNCKKYRAPKHAFQPSQPTARRRSCMAHMTMTEQTPAHLVKIRTIPPAQEDTEYPLAAAFPSNHLF